MKLAVQSRAVQKLEGARILITGASGYLAWNLLRSLDAVDCEITCLTRKPSIKFEGISSSSRIRVLSGEADWPTLLKNTDYVFHFAAQTSVPVSNADPVLDLQQNVATFVQMLEASRALEKKPFFLIPGSESQAGLPLTFPVDESFTDKPESIYCLHKLFNEQYLELYTRQSWARGTCLRLANVYGPGPKSSSADRGVLNQITLRALRKEPISIYGSGEHLRDYVYVTDVVNAFLAAAVASDKTNGNHYITASGVGTKLKDAFWLSATLVSQVTGNPILLSHIDPPQGSSAVDFRNFVGNIDRIKTDTSWSPKVSLEQGLTETITYFINQKETHS